MAIASTKGARQRVATTMRRIGVKVAARTKYLGIDYRPCRSREGLGTELRKRWKKAAVKKTRMRKIGGGIGASLVRSHLAATARHGVTVGGIPSNVLKEVATAAAGMYGPLGGRSATARLAVRRADPRTVLATRPIQAWATIIWTASLEVDVLKDAWMQAQAEVGLSKRPHRAVTGGVGAWIAELKRVQWTSPSYNAVITREGLLLDMSKHDVKTVMRAAYADHAAVLA